MPLTLYKETGAGLSYANCYAHRDDAVIYHRAHLYASAWDLAIDADKEKALVMATRLIDAQWLFGGVRTHAEQALQWPRQGCPDRDAETGLVEEDVLPQNLTDATCEMARELLVVDRTTAPPGEGLKYANVGSTQTGYSKTDVRPILTHVTQALLKRFGVSIETKSGTVNLVRT